jgi:hypothetical protein
MKAKRNLLQIGLLCAALLPAGVQAQFTCTTNADNTLTITGYTGSGGATPCSFLGVAGPNNALW